MCSMSVSEGKLMIDVRFSPEGGCTDKIVSIINSSQKDINILAYVFTSNEIMNALIEADKRIVKINLIMDSMGSIGHGCLVDDLIHNTKAKVRVDHQHSIAHNKIMIIDSSILITGSFNFSSAAEHKNAENLLIVQDEEKILKMYIDNFELHWYHSDPYFKSKIKLIPGYIPDF